MTIGYMYILLIIVGLAGIVWGLPSAHRLKFPFDTIAALVALCGVIVFALGILLTFIPGFFRG
ncbi:MAG: hypothetical protein A2076_00390 [Geobacteraceae bacterium GWC2_53_11]|nr:MAG: hypothetical protein A2076_00390 [Geobacteraceae bacterium GWC2_53_11]